MFATNVGRAAKMAALVAVVAAAPMLAAAQGGTGPSAGTGSSASTGSSGARSAETGTGQMPPSPAAMQRMKPTELYNMMDKNKDGYVTKEEFLKFEERVFDSWDKNQAGRLNAAMFNDQG